VTRTLVGYQGGVGLFPNYGTYVHMGFSEAVWVEYDPKLLTYQQLVDVFFASHDPTFHASVAYRSIVFYQTTDQFDIANKTLEKIKSQSKLTVWTTLKNGTEFTFWPAEDYHQHYIVKMGDRCPDNTDPAPEACPGSFALPWQSPPRDDHRSDHADAPGSSWHRRCARRQA